MKQIRSPFRRATAHDLEMIREAVTAVLDWEYEIPERPVPWPSFWDSKTVRGLSEHTRYADTHNEAMARAVQRLALREDAAQIWKNMADAKLRKDFPAAYEVRLLRDELAAGSLDSASLSMGLQRLESALQR